MQYLAAPLRRERRITDNVHNRDELAVRAAQSAKGAQLARAKRRDHSAAALLTGVAVGCVGPDQLVRGADPLQPGRPDEVKEVELVIYIATVQVRLGCLAGSLGL